MEGLFYVNDFLKKLMYDELKHHCAAQGKRNARELNSISFTFHTVAHTGVGGFLPAVKQIGNVAALPGIVGVRVFKLILE